MFEGKRVVHRLGIVVRFNASGRRRGVLIGLLGVVGTLLSTACSVGETEEASSRGATTCTVSRDDAVAVESGSLAVPGADLYYEIRGSGPLLLLIHGGMSDTTVFDLIAPILAEDYAVLTYDRRGNSRSELTGDPEEADVTEQADDARRLLDQFCSEPAYVFGSSGGGTVGLELATRFPDHVDTLVTHEPTVFALAPDAQAVQAGYEAVHDLYLAEGPLTAMREFLTVGNPDVDESDVSRWEPADEQMAENMEFLLAHEMLPFIRYEPDVDALRSGPARILPGAGADTGTNSVFLATEALAGLLGLDVALFPGDHTGYVSPQAADFAERLHEVLGSRG
jgi:pimeloyl-ACP methyl ester carboxylesterase